MSEEEREVLKTFKKGLGLTSAEQEILVNYIDKLQKENKEYIDIFNSTEKIMNGQERTKDKLLKENVELQKENEELKEQRDNAIKLRNELIEEQKITCVSKNKIRNKIKELEVKYKKHEKEGLYGFADRLDIGTRIDVLRELLGE